MVNPFATKLLDWYAQHKRDLPWRGSRDPYVIWLSEIILQQTRVEQGMPYFHKFLNLFPDVHSLARAPQDDVLKAWEGLGYYSRARNLHKSAIKVSSEMDGVFPKDYVGLLELPGVGPYTAAAIASICYEERVPVIDGNVNRFISRLMALTLPVDSGPGRKSIHEFLLPAIAEVTSPGDFNQSLMEFGARHCVPRSPDCSSCVFRDNCEARRLGTIEEFPIKKSKVKVRTRFFNYHVILFEGKTYLRQRVGSGIWQGLYEFILEEKEEASQDFKSILDGSDLSPVLEKRYTHILSHQRIHATFIVYEVASAPEIAGAVSLSLDDLDDVAMARVTTRFLEENSARVKTIAQP